MATVTVHSDFGAQENKVCHGYHFPPLFAMKWWARCHHLIFFVCLLHFWMLCFKPDFSLSSFTFIKRLFSSSSLSAISVVWSAYLKLLIFLVATLIPACESSSPAFYMMYSAWKLNKLGDNIQPWRTPFPTLNHSIVPIPVLTVSSCPAYRFLGRQVR